MSEPAVENDEIAQFEDAGAEQNEFRQRQKQAAKNWFKRGLPVFLVIGGLLVWTLFFSGGGAPANTAQQISSGGDVRETAATSTLAENSPVRQGALEAEAEAYARAKQEGISKIDRIKLETQSADALLGRPESAGAKTKAVLEVGGGLSRDPGPRVDGRPVNGSNTNASGGTPDYLQEELARLARSRASVNKQFGAVFEIAKRQPAHRASINYEAADSKSEQKAMPSANCCNESGSTVVGSGGQRIVMARSDSLKQSVLKQSVSVEPNDMFLAQVVVGYNSDQPGSIGLEILTPPLDGAQLVTSDITPVGETILAKFSSIRFRGVTSPIKAVSINPENFAQGYASDVDHNYIERWGPFLIGAFGEKWAESLTNTTTQRQPDGSVVSEKSPISDDKRVEYTVTAGLGQILPMMKSQIDRPSTYTLNGGDQIAVWILEAAEVGYEHE